MRHHYSIQAKSCRVITSEFNEHHFRLRITQEKMFANA